MSPLSHLRSVIIILTYIANVHAHNIYSFVLGPGPGCQSNPKAAAIATHLEAGLRLGFVQANFRSEGAGQLVLNSTGSLSWPTSLAVVGGICVPSNGSTGPSISNLTNVGQLLSYGFPLGSSSSGEELGPSLMARTANYLMPTNVPIRAGLEDELVAMVEYLSHGHGSDPEALDVGVGFASGDAGSEAALQALVSVLDVVQLGPVSEVGYGSGGGSSAMKQALMNITARMGAVPQVWCLCDFSFCLLLFD